jgi:hypothetical protein
MPKTSSGSRLRDVPARAIVEAIAEAAERWRDADFPPRVRATAAIEARLGYSTPVVDFALDRLFESLTADALVAAIDGDLGALAALDGPLAQSGRPRGWARGVEHVTIVSSDTTIGVAIVPLAFALCAKSRVTVKDRSDALVAAFAATLVEALPAFAGALDVRTWTGGDAAIEAEALGAADVVVAFGGSDALRAIRAACAPDATFVPYGHRASAGYVGPRALDGNLDELAAAIARDALLYDGDGCLSLHLLFLERADAERMERFARALADACEATAIEFPPGRRDPARGAQVRAWSTAAAFRAANGHGCTLRAPDGTWTVVLDASLDDVPPFGGGAIPVIVVDGIDDAAAAIRAHGIPLQALALDPATPGDEAFAIAAALGAVRVTAFGRLQVPPVAGRHGGRPRIAEFIRWIDGA